MWPGGRRKNRFHFFGGKDEGSAALIQGMTLGGVLLDEAAVMPRSFIEQAMARCSEEGAKVWMSLNPEGRTHWPLPGVDFKGGGEKGAAGPLYDGG